MHVMINGITTIWDISHFSYKIYKKQLFEPIIDMSKSNLSLNVLCFFHSKNYICQQKVIIMTFDISSLKYY